MATEQKGASAYSNTSLKEKGIERVIELTYSPFQENIIGIRGKDTQDEVDIVPSREKSRTVAILEDQGDSLNVHSGTDAIVFYVGIDSKKEDNDNQVLWVEDWAQTEEEGFRPKGIYEENDPTKPRFQEKSLSLADGKNYLVGVQTTTTDEESDKNNHKKNEMPYVIEISDTDSNPKLMWVDASGKWHDYTIPPKFDKWGELMSKIHGVVSLDGGRAEEIFQWVKTTSTTAKTNGEWTVDSASIIEEEVSETQTRKPTPQQETVRKNGFSLAEYVQEPEVVKMGPVFTRTDIKTTEGPFRLAPEYKTEYPDVVKDAIIQVYKEYNGAFDRLVHANSEWDTDYQYTRVAPGGKPVNFFVQIDMVGLPNNFLQDAKRKSKEEVYGAVKPNIFELENSLAMYQLLMKIFSQYGGATNFEQNFRRGLDAIRQKYDMPIAILAVTEEKYRHMLEAEFGKTNGRPLFDEEVRELSGFDKFHGPQQFYEELRRNGGNSKDLLTVRSSDPVTKLRKPGTHVENPLLENDDMRRVIKANSITLNIDNPAWPMGDVSRINDNKAYMIDTDMGFPIFVPEDIDSQRLRNHLMARGIDPQSVLDGSAKVRAKPMYSSYGGYGHHHAELNNKKFRADVRKGVRDRGPYIAQPEMQTPTIIDSNGTAYNAIDRVFFMTDGDNYQMMGGFRSLIPKESVEAKRGRNHGSEFTVWSEIY